MFSLEANISQNYSINWIKLMLLIFLLQHLRISESFQVMLQLIRVLQLDLTYVYMDMYICSSNNPKPAFWFYLRPALVNYHVQKVAEKNRNIGILSKYHYNLFFCLLYCY